MIISESTCIVVMPLLQGGGVHLRYWYLGVHRHTVGICVYVCMSCVYVYVDSIDEHISVQGFGIRV